MGSHGTISVASPEPGEFDQADVELAQILAANAAAALDRIEREARLERQNERLVELSGLNSLIRRIHRAIIEATTREEITTNVCETLVATDAHLAAWIGTYRTDGKVRVQATAGATGEISDADRIPAGDDTLTDELVGTAHRTRTVQVVRDLPDGRTADPWHERLFDLGCREAVAIPLTAGEATYGVLALYVDRDAFDEEVVAILRELGQTIGRAIRAAQTRRALVADSAIELELGVADPRSFLVAASADLECRLDLDGIVPLGGDRLLYYVTAEGTSTEAFRDWAVESAGVGACRVVSDIDAGGVFEVRSSGGTAIPTLLDYGATVRRAVADPDDVRITVEIPPDADARTVLTGLQEACPGAQLLRKRALDRPVRTVQQFRKILTGRLTDKQLNALRAAYFAGYFEWPRESTAEEIAGAMEVSSSTFHFHLRHALGKLLRTYFEAQRAE